jgi:antirestriction protein ArdC
MSRKEGKGPRIDIYARITDRIVAELAKGVRPWMQPWHSANAIGRVTRPLRHNGLPYSGMNVLLLWSEAIARGFATEAAPAWNAWAVSAVLAVLAIATLSAFEEWANLALGAGVRGER